MQDAKESLKNLVTPVTEKYHKWEIRHLWPARILEYFLLVLLVAVVGAIFFKFFNLFQTDADSARYMLSALVQSQAAIIAIVISLTLIAVQLTASAYSPRVIRMFLRTPDMWILLVLYGFSISYGLLILKLIRTEDLQQIILFGYSLEHHIVTLYLYGGFTFIGLFLYTWNIINLLNPATIINRLAAEITPDNLLKSKEDPIQPIMDIVHGSIMKYDIATTRVGLRALTDQLTKIIDRTVEEEISLSFVNSLQRFGEFAITKNDEESTIEVINGLYILGYSTAKNRLESTLFFVVIALGSLKEKTMAKGLDDATNEVTKFLGTLGEVAVKNKQELTAEQVIIHLENLGRFAAKKDFRDFSLYETVVDSLVNMGAAAIHKGLEDIANRAAESLAKLTFLDEKLVKFFIERCEESITEEQDRASFKKFMELYEQELQRLRAEQQE